MGIHLGEGRLRTGRVAGEPEDYVGIDVNYAARIAAAGNGGQIVLSDALVATLPRGLTALAGLADVVLVDDGPRAVKDFEDPRPALPAGRPWRGRRSRAYSGRPRSRRTCPAT